MSRIRTCADVCQRVYNPIPLATQSSCFFERSEAKRIEARISTFKNAILFQYGWSRTKKQKKRSAAVPFGGSEALPRFFCGGSAFKSRLLLSRIFCRIDRIVVL